jgi:hypothetical protein
LTNWPPRPGKAVSRRRHPSGDARC